jgi:hypothetical protein
MAVEPYRHMKWRLKVIQCQPSYHLGGIGLVLQNFVKAIFLQSYKKYINKQILKNGMI